MGLKNSVSGITIIAIGTSLPDTFASRSAALQDVGADASIGNITGNACGSCLYVYHSLSQLLYVFIYCITVTRLVA